MKRKIRLPIVAAPAVLLALVFASCAAPTAAMKKEAAARMQMGVTYLEQRNLPAAMRELTHAEKLDPDNPKIDMTLGLAYQARGDLGKAEDYLRQSIRKDPNYAAAHNNLGNLLSLKGKHEEAIREYRQAAGNVLYPTPEYAYYNMGREYSRMQDFTKAEAMYRRAIAMNQSFADAYRELARAQSARGDWKESAQTLKRLVELIPSDALGWMDLGSVYVRLDRREEAVAAFRNALSKTEDPAVRKRATGYINILEHEKR